jgi:hypothetical protein
MKSEGLPSSQLCPIRPCYSVGQPILHMHINSLRAANPGICSFICYIMLEISILCLEDVLIFFYSRIVQKLELSNNDTKCICEVMVTNISYRLA